MVNPYHFVPFPEISFLKKHYTTLEKRFKAAQENLLSGYIECRMETISKFSIKSVFEQAADQAQRENSHTAHVYVPGSSIRGMIRAVLEALGFGCGFFFSRDYEIKRDKCYNPSTRSTDHTVIYKLHDCQFPDKKFAELKGKDPKELLSEFASCATRIEQTLGSLNEKDREKRIPSLEICPVCSLFGFTSVVSAASRLKFMDTDMVETKLVAVSLPQLQSPRPYHTGFYFQNPGDWSVTRGQPAYKQFRNGIYNGRKFYLHRRNDQHLSGRDVDVYVPEESVKFSFRIYFNHLSEFELGMLLFAISPDEDIRHKLGYGKPVGLGKIRLQVDKVRNKSNDPFDFAAKSFSELNHQELVDKFTEQTHILETQQFRMLKEIWRSQGYQTQYPDLNWFRPANLTRTLDEFNGGNGPRLNTEDKSKKAGSADMIIEATIKDKSKRRGYLLIEYKSEEGKTEARIEKVNQKYPQIWKSAEVGGNIKISVNQFGAVKIVDDE